MTKPKCRIFLGTSGWAYQDWAGRFYPKKLASKKWLEFYAQQFDTVELNATFYHSFSEKIYQNWYERTPPNFTFVVKMSRFITHRKRLIDVADSIQWQEQNCAPLKEKLALYLLQLPPRMAYAPERLFDALAAFADPSKVAVEFRDRKWLTPEILKILQQFNAVCCNVDSPKLKIENTLTSTTGYIRLHGRIHMYGTNYSSHQLDKVVEQVTALRQKGARKIFIYFNNDFLGFATRNACFLSKKLAKLSYITL